MITRIVKMVFREECLPDFFKMFEAKKSFIVAQPGCQDVEMLQDVKDECIVFTYSHWDSEADLNAYRKTETFGAVWKETKSYFAGKPEAWSTQSLYKVVS